MAVRRSTQALPLVLLLHLSILAFGRPARADGGPLGSGCYACALWMPFGVNLGAGPRWRQGDRTTELLLGGEVSLIDLRGMRTREGWFLGGYLDTVRDLRAHIFRTSLGPEAIFYKKRFDYAFGVDLGVVGEWNSSQVTWGGRIRAFFPLVFITPYVGFTRLGIHDPANLIEAGLLLKFPAVLAN